MLFGNYHALCIGNFFALGGIKVYTWLLFHIGLLAYSSKHRYENVIVKKAIRIESNSLG